MDRVLRTLERAEHAWVQCLLLVQRLKAWNFSKTVDRSWGRSGKYPFSFFMAEFSDNILLFASQLGILLQAVFVGGPKNLSLW